MGDMQQSLGRIFSEVGGLSYNKLPFPRHEDVAHSDQAQVIDDIYRKLGGVLPTAELNLRHWDMEFDGVAVELDEYLHFNRYRTVTLESPAYRQLPNFPLELYRQYCFQHEDKCLRAGGYGGKWSNPSCERQFGVGAKPKYLEKDGGAPRWKQRAFYDFVKDLSPLLIGVKVVRIAIWDQVKDGATMRTIEDVLKRPSPLAAQSIVELIRTRSA